MHTSERKSDASESALISDFCPFIRSESGHIILSTVEGRHCTSEPEGTFITDGETHDYLKAEGYSIHIYKPCTQHLPEILAVKGFHKVPAWEAFGARQFQIAKDNNSKES